MKIEKELAFPIEEYQERLRKVRETMVQRGIDLLLVHSPANICWISGYQTFDLIAYSCLIIPLEQSPVTQLWDLEEGNLLLTAWFENASTFTPEDNIAEQLAGWIKNNGFSKGQIGIELSSRWISAANYEQVRKLLPDTKFVNASGLVEELRLIKSPTELDYIRRACQITDEGVEAAFAAATVGKTENDVAAAAASALFSAGSEYMCNSPIVSVGRRASIPHSTHKREKIRAGDTLFIEFGGTFQRYSGLIMRTAVAGAPSDIVRKIADACIDTVNRLIEVIGPDVPGTEVVAHAEPGLDSIREIAHWHGNFAYSTGLGFSPTWADCGWTIRPGSKEVIHEGMVLHLPIVVRIIGEVGVGFSETVIVTDKGCEVVTQSPRELVIF